MSTPQFPFGMDPESLRDAPLFRELQRVMSSSSGPVQWELARQLAVAGAAEEGNDPQPNDADRTGLEDALRVAELQVVDFTGLEPANDLLRVALARRADWIAGAIDAYRPLVESAATRLQDALGRAMVEQLPSDADAENPLAALGLGSPQDLIRQLGPLLQATQIGQVLGFLAARVLGDHDVGIPHAVTGPIGFVVTNIERVEADWSLDPREFRTFVALHQVAHRLQAERPWLPAYAARTVDDFLSTMTIDVDAIQQRFATLAPGDPESLQAAFGGEDDAMFGVVLDDEQRLKLDRIRALVGAVEGHGDHVATTIGAKLLGSYPQIEEAMRRYRDDEELDPLFARLLGVDVGREHVELGRRFCDSVVELTDEATLTRMWTDADALPGLAELEEPRLWLARTV
ncbi:MAG TPA: zinc-dependent metalloprotease [Actinomycetota bacterium]|jgi:putative hydrolase|nr:zinc-dependent metalloprotease [Actinomycetota bacterium]